MLKYTYIITLGHIKYYIGCEIMIIFHVKGQN